LCAIDFSDWSLAALDLASSLARASGAALTILHVIEWPWAEPQAPRLDELPENQAAALAEYRRYVERSASDRLEMIVRERCPAKARVAHGKPYREILRVASEMDVDLIVAGVHSRGATDLMLFGSTTNQLVRHAECPVLTVRR
jgi:nucleotide-binding universal stress UspA family protein